MVFALNDMDWQMHGQVWSPLYAFSLWISNKNA
jgi:hypothetical protein